MVHKDKRMRLVAYLSLYPLAVLSMFIGGIAVYHTSGEADIIWLCVLAPGLLASPILIYLGISIDWRNLDEPEPEAKVKKDPRPASAVDY